MPDNLLLRLGLGFFVGFVLRSSIPELALLLALAAMALTSWRVRRAYHRVVHPDPPPERLGVPATGRT
ncbi:MAG: hypothetical protein ACRDTM_08210 [Micromonosporaceae bacterium]